MNVLQPVLEIFWNKTHSLTHSLTPGALDQGDPSPLEQAVSIFVCLAPASSSCFLLLLAGADLLWPCRPIQGCHIGFFNAKFQKSGFFSSCLAGKFSFGFLAFFWLFFLPPIVNCISSHFSLSILPIYQFCIYPKWDLIGPTHQKHQSD